MIENKKFLMKAIKLLKYSVIAVLVVLLLGLGFIYSGLFPIGADNKHSAMTFWAIETLRTKSIARASKYIEVSSLTDPQLY